MNWTQLLKSEIESTYASTQRLLDKVDPGTLDWKPATGQNWMTVGQLLRHLADSCGTAFRGFVTGDWGMPEGVKMEDLPPDQMLPPAEKMPTAASIAETKRLLAEDQALALKILAGVSDEELATRETAAPWNPGTKYALGRHLLQMVQHLEKHKSQLFYYLKLQGKPVNTGDLWG